MTHRDTVIDRNGVELFGDTTGRFDFTRDQLAQIFQMHMARYELGEGVYHGDDGLTEITLFHAGGTPQGTGTRHIAAFGGRSGTVLRHSFSPWRSRLGGFG